MWTRHDIISRRIAAILLPDDVKTTPSLNLVLPRFHFSNIWHSFSLSHFFTISCWWSIGHFSVNIFRESVWQTMFSIFYPLLDTWHFNIRPGSDKIPGQRSNSRHWGCHPAPGALPNTPSPTLPRPFNFIIPIIYRPFFPIISIITTSAPDLSQRIVILLQSFVFELSYRGRCLLGTLF